MANQGWPTHLRSLGLPLLRDIQLAGAVPGVLDAIQVIHRRGQPAVEVGLKCRVVGDDGQLGGHTYEAGTSMCTKGALACVVLRLDG